MTINVFKPATFLSMSVPVALFSAWQGNQVIAVGAGLISAASLLVAWLSAEKKTGCQENTKLPSTAIKTLSSSLHHSQIPLFEQVIQPMMASKFESLQAITVGKTLAGYDISLFDEKVTRLQDAFRKLKASGVFYRKRVLDERDRAITLLIFIAIFFKEDSCEERIKAVYQAIPNKAFKLLRKEAYRLFDLHYLLLEGRLIVNHDVVDDLSALSLLNQYSNATKTPATSVVDPTNNDEAYQNVSSDLPDKSQVPITDNSKSTSPVAVVEEVNQNEAPTNSTEQNSNNDTKAIEKTRIDTQQAVVNDFMSWLEKRISSGNRQFALDSQNLVVSNVDKYGDKQVFVLPDLLGKYQSRSGISIDDMKRELFSVSTLKASVYLESGDDKVELVPCELSKPFESTASSPIKEGDSLCAQQ